MKKKTLSFSHSLSHNLPSDLKKKKTLTLTLTPTHHEIHADADPPSNPCHHRHFTCTIKKKKKSLSGSALIWMVVLQSLLILFLGQY